MSDDRFQVVVHQGGTLIKEVSIKYIGGEIAYWDVDPDKLCYFGILGSLKHLGYIEVQELYYNVEHVLHKLYDDKGDKNMMKVANHLGNVNLYFVHGMDDPVVVENYVNEILYQCEGPAESVKGVGGEAHVEGGDEGIANIEVELEKEVENEDVVEVENECAVKVENDDAVEVENEGAMEVEVESEQAVEVDIEVGVKDEPGMDDLSGNEYVNQDSYNETQQQCRGLLDDDWDEDKVCVGPFSKYAKQKSMTDYRWEVGTIFSDKDDFKDAIGKKFGSQVYLRERLDLVRNLPVTHSQYDTLNNTFERALVTMHKMPRIWIMYLQTLTNQKLITRTRKTFDRALCALPEPYLVFVSQKGIPIETSLRVYRRYLKYDPSHIEDFIEFLLNSSLWQEASERLAWVLNDEQFYSIKGKTKHRHWLELCDLLTRHANEVSGLNVDAIIRGGIRKFTDEMGRLWTSLAEYYIRRGLHEKAKDVFEEGMSTVITVRDFSIIFDSYSQFEESMLGYKMEEMGLSNEEDDECEENFLHGFWLNEKNEIDLRLAITLWRGGRNWLTAWFCWHRRVKLFEGNPTKQILTYTEAVRTIDPMKAVGKPHTLWVAFAKLYEQHKDVGNARVIFDKAVQVNYKTVDNLASIWCEWADMELKIKNFKGALELMRRATAEPSVEYLVMEMAADGNEPVQMKLYKSLRLWTLYVNLEENLGSLESTRAAYERILDLRIATPQIIINYAYFLEKWVLGWNKRRQATPYTSSNSSAKLNKKKRTG
ncbi:hypothetical protein V8G54_012739 [Vigna mungo]|uniref:Uncharacterized protein n=1 Tax=Vigna mungo TaxID=3915 RepID=A0AAQ3NVC6_VIGMU